jgi:hypothetical protein
MSNLPFLKIYIPSGGQEISRLLRDQNSITMLETVSTGLHSGRVEFSPCPHTPIALRSILILSYY